MKILKIQVLRGPNIWSNYRNKLIQVRLDLEEMENFPTDKLPGFRARLEKILPTLFEHECSEAVSGGFFERVERGTWLGHVIEHVALEIQSLAGAVAGYGRTRGTSEAGVYNVVFTYEIEEAGCYAAEAAFRIVSALSQGETYDLQNDIIALTQIRLSNTLGPSTQSIVTEAEKRGIPWRRIGKNSNIILGYGKNQVRFQATITDRTSMMSVEIAGDKEETKLLLAKAKIPVAKGGVCSNEIELQKIIETIGYPIVVKPISGNQGKGASIGIDTWEDAKKALAYAQRYSNAVLVEKCIEGFDFRILVVDNKYVAAAQRIPAHVTGDGQSTISQLIDIVNSDPKRGIGHSKILTEIKIDHDSEAMLAKQNLTIKSILPAGKTIMLKSTANLSTGGTAVDMTDKIHPENIFLAERISRIVGLDICGIDIMARNLHEPIQLTGGVVIEVNAAPGFRMHLAPSEGKSRNVAAAVVDMLYPPGKESRIPIFAVTGTNGKTTTTRLLAHMAKNCGYKVGYTTTDGIYIGNSIIEEGDTTGPLSAAFILGDPSVEFAVLETARGGILRAGLSFNQCDVGIITNIREDHLGLKDINTLEQLANVKAVVAHSVKHDGWAVLNGDDVHCVNIGSQLDCNVAYFSLDERSELVTEQVLNEYPVGVLENGFITILIGKTRIRIENVSHVPITFDGKAQFMVANALGAALAGYLWGFSVEDIKYSLQSFIPSPEQTPGRMNHFKFKNFDVVVDYAHNAHGYTAMEKYLLNISAKNKIGIISGIGDRRNSDIKECAAIACRMFDHIIIRQEHDLRGRTEEAINSLLLQGFAQSGSKVTYEIIPKETDAILRALSLAGEGDLVVALSEEYKSVIAVISEALKEDSVISAKQVKPVEKTISIHQNNNYHGRTA